MVGGPAAATVATVPEVPLDFPRAWVEFPDPADPDQRLDASFDGRTSAVSSSSMRMLTATGVADHFPVPGCPILKIQVADGLAPGGLAFEPGEGDEPLGWMHENRHLRAALRARAEAGKNVQRFGVMRCGVGRFHVGA